MMKLSSYPVQGLVAFTLLAGGAAAQAHAHRHHGRLRPQGRGAARHCVAGARRGHAPSGLAGDRSGHLFLL